MYYKFEWWDQLFKHLINHRIQTRASMNPIREDNSQLVEVQVGTDSGFKVIQLEDDYVKYIFSSNEGTVEYLVRGHLEHHRKMYLHEVRNTLGKVYNVKEPSVVVERIMQECYTTGLQITTSIRYD